MGEVWRAYDSEQQREVALKVLPAVLSGDAEYVARFQREARVAARLTDPHIVPIHRFGEHDGRLFIDMRLIHGWDLSRVLAAERALAPARAVGVVEQVTSALDAAHGAGLVHRDVKPANALLPARGPEFVYLVDFGIARVVDADTRSRLTTTGDTIGSLEYMAPERFGAGPIDRRVDVYSLGCVLHECLTGAKPFPYGEFGALIHAHLNQPAPRPSSTHPALVAFDPVIARALAKDPADRYATCGELAAAARAALTTAPTLVRGASPAPVGAVPDAAPAGGWGPPNALVGARPDRTRHRLWAAAALVVALGMIATITTVILRGDDQGGSAEERDVSSRPFVGVMTGHTDNVNAVTTAQRDGRTVVISGSADESVRIWDLATGRPVGPPLTDQSNRIQALAVGQRDGRTVIVAGGFEGLRLWDLDAAIPIGRIANGEVPGELGVHYTQALTIAQRDGRAVVLAGISSGVVAVDLATGRRLREEFAGTTEGVAPMTVNIINAVGTAQVDGRDVVIAGGSDDIVRAWDLATGRPVGQALVGHTDDVASVTSAQLDGRTVIISGSHDETIRVWDLATGRLVGQPLTGHQSWVRAVTTAQDAGRTVIVSGARDGTVRVWDLATGQPVGHPLTGCSATESVTTAQRDDRTVIIAGCIDGTIHVWDMP
ncbi:WD40 repeat domain-containing serine/threonine protein kinase [Nocardia sp. CA-290969]|uniref:WD40 repeat domain-containing serine/threonine protein kinase n=1 Tax=Nocardia sp. CA-290969 TaxID=3239986 RepID=UPI003D90026B